MNAVDAINFHYFPKSWKMIKIATIEITSTNKSMTSMPIKILEAADGLRLKALITAYPKTAMTIDGPKTAINMIETIKSVSAHCILEPAFKHGVWHPGLQARYPHSSFYSADEGVPILRRERYNHSQRTVQDQI